MKKISLLLVILAISILSYSQILVGSSYNYIQKTIPDLVINQHDGFYSACNEDSQRVLVYYFNKQNICFMYAIILKNDDDLSLYTEEFDRRYSLIKEFLWKEVETNMLIDVVRIDNKLFIRFYYNND